jgi:hypothetical protein
LHDTDDEVRDRATFYHRILSSSEAAEKLMVEKLSVPLQNLEHDLVEYLQVEDPEGTFDVSKVATVATKTHDLKAAAESKKKTGPANAVASPDLGAKRNESNPELEAFGLGPKLASSRLLEVGFVPSFLRSVPSFIFSFLFIASVRIH